MKLFTFLLAIFFFSCTEKNSSVDYYFPVKDFLVEKTDCFVNKNDTADKAYWKMKTIISGKDTLMQTRVYDGDWRIVDSIVEKVTNGNAELRSYTLFDYPEEKKVQSNCTIIKPAVFKRDQHNGESIEWKISFKDPRSLDLSELSKTRSQVSENGKQKVFFDKLKFRNTITGRGYDYEATITYEKGKGLISYKMVLPDGTEKNYELVSRN
jgi:hypothetical protein